MNTASQREDILRLARAPQALRRQEALDRIQDLGDLAERRAIILTILADPSHAARETAIACLEHWCHLDPELVDAVLDRTDDPRRDPGELQAIVVGLRRMALPDEVPSSWYSAPSAQSGGGEGFDPAGGASGPAATEARVQRLTALLDRLATHDDPDVRYQAWAARELRGESGPAYVAALCARLEHDDDAEIRVIAAQGLTRLGGGEEVIAALEGALRRATAAERIHHLLALAHLGAPGLTAALLDEARRGQFRFPALVALGEYGDPAAIEPLLKLARGWFGEALHKVAASAAAARLGSGEGRALLERFAASKKPELRGFALQSLAQMGVEGIVARLREAAREPRDPARLQAIELLGRHGDATDRAWLEGLRDDRDEEVRAAAQAALE